ncbi:MAG: immune inhibitor A domain-containing protein [Vicinamibacteraceae bacterium]
MSFAVATLVAGVSLSSAQQAPPADALEAAAMSVAPGRDAASNHDDRAHPKGDAQRALKQRALQARLAGKSSGKTHRVANGQYVELERQGEDSIWTVLGQFGTQVNPLYGGLAGPSHNQIPQPNRAVDNTTIWSPDFSRAYYENLLFSEAPGAVSMRNFYIEISSNRYAVNGGVTDWVQVPFNEANYGANYCGGIVCARTWLFVRDSLNAWYAGQLAAGRTAQQIDDYLSRFDVWDRYDYDGDGNFNEPDGYIDHFQSVHAGDGEETGGGAQGSNAIWSHRWYAFYTNIGATGPAYNLGGGLRVGNSSYWVGDYTIEPENGGVGVFSHEFGHDLGLPDLYDSVGDNSTGFWTIMSSGSYGNDGTVDIGSKPTHMGAWEKFQLGWLNYEVAVAGRKSSHKLGPAETNTKQAQALFVLLPDKQVSTSVGTPYAGANFYFSGSGNNLDTRMTRAFSLPAGAQLSAQVRYDIEADWDYAYLVVSTNGGATWTNVPTNRSTVTNPNGQNFGNGITGSTSGWVPLTANLSAYTGNVLLGFRYWTDGAVIGGGFQVDDIAVTGSTVDGAEAPAGWAFAPATGGFRVTTGVETAGFFNTYIAEFRQYRETFDSSLQTGPYNFGFGNNPALRNYAERYPYQDGLLISYWDGSQGDNDASVHPGAGLILPIDSHPEPLIRPDVNVPWSARRQAYDSPFGLDTTDVITLHANSVPGVYGGLPAVPTFNDTLQYWRAATPSAGVRNPHTNTVIEIRSISAHDSFMQVQVRPAK